MGLRLGQGLRLQKFVERAFFLQRPDPAPSEIDAKLSVVLNVTQTST